MGYYTNYDLEFTAPTHERALEIIKVLTTEKCPKTDYYWAGIFCQPRPVWTGASNAETYDCDTACDIKWYDNDLDMLELSARFPETLFSLHGVGEESDDEWEEEYLGGKKKRFRKMLRTWGDWLNYT